MSDRFAPPSLGLAPADTADAKPVYAVSEAKWEGWLAKRPARQRAWIAARGFKPKAGEVVVLPAADGTAAAAVVGLGTDEGDAQIWAYAALVDALPAGAWTLAGRHAAAVATRATLGWALATYRYDRYKAVKKPIKARFLPSEGADLDHVRAVAEAMFLARDLINTPASDLGPAQLAEAARDLASRQGAAISVLQGEELIAHNWPAVHAVGKGSVRPPHVIDLTWGDAAHPKVTLVGKGVCFDSGGLDLKTSSGMLMMKKDMGGAATLLGLASLVMASKLPVRLRVIIPAVENMPSGSAFRPLDVLATRKGITVEVGNTDAEGRLILCDALAEADAEKPALLIDCATLTGAARVALGPELPVVFTRQDDLAERIVAAGTRTDDPLYRLPLWPGYRKMLDSKVADISSTGNAPYAGSITAALFLAEFVDPATRWVHIDTMAWNTKSRAGRPEGGEALGLRALFEVVAAVAKPR